MANPDIGSSWSMGPRNSGYVRWMLYLAVGSLTSAFLFVALLLGVSIAIIYPVEPMLAIGLLLFAIFAIGIVAAREAAFFRESFWESWLAQEFRSVARIPWLVLATVVVTGFLILLVVLWNFWETTFVTLVLAIIFYGGAHTISGRGEFQAQEQRITFKDGDELDLNRLQNPSRFSIGPHTFLWVSETAEDSPNEKGLYVVPTEIIDKT